MSKKEDLTARLRSRPRDFTISELDSLMAKCNCRKDNRGGTSGSAIAYIHESGRVFRLHSPHPGRELKPYMVKSAIAFLEQVSEI